jgi:hypothetical protein
MQEFRFNVKGPQDGVSNGGMTIEATFGNLQGVSPNAAASLVLEYCGPGDHPGDPAECREVAHYFNLFRPPRSATTIRSGPLRTR